MEKIKLGDQVYVKGGKRCTCKVIIRGRAFVHQPSCVLVSKAGVEPESCRHQSTIGLNDITRWCQSCGAIQVSHPGVKKRDWMLPEKEKSLHA
jgi:hypothetical protein